MRTRLYIVDDESAIRETLARLLLHHLRDLDPIVIQLSCAEDLVEWLVEDPDHAVVVTDNNTKSRKTGLEALCELRTRGIQTPIMLFSGDELDASRRRILDDCRAQHVRKSSSGDITRLVEFIRTAVADMRSRACAHAADAHASL